MHLKKLFQKVKLNNSQNHGWPGNKNLNKKLRIGYMKMEIVANMNLKEIKSSLVRV